MKCKLAPSPLLCPGAAREPAVHLQTEKRSPQTDRLWLRQGDNPAQPSADALLHTLLRW